MRSSAAGVTVAVITSLRRERDSQAMPGNLDIAARWLDPGQPIPEAEGSACDPSRDGPTARRTEHARNPASTQEGGGHSQSRASGRPAEGPPDWARGLGRPQRSSKPPIRSRRRRSARLRRSLRDGSNRIVTVELPGVRTSAFDPATCRVLWAGGGLCR
jgi:hypothetical protein